MDTPSTVPVEAFVLAGGGSTRFGSDKALAVVDGAPLLTHALRAAEGMGLRLRVVCPDPEPYRSLARDFVVSERPGRGPAEGVRAALAECEAPRALILAVDMPGVDARLLRALVETADPADRGEPITCFQTPDGRRHPFPGLYPRTALAVLDGSEAPLSMHRLLEWVGVRLLTAAELAGDFDLPARLANLNRPGDGPPPRR